MTTALVAHSGGPTSVINASLAGIIEQARGERAIGRLLGARFGLDGILAEDFVDLLALPSSAVAAMADAPSATALSTGADHFGSRESRNLPHERRGVPLLYRRQRIDGHRLADWELAPRRGSGWT